MAWHRQRELAALVVHEQQLTAIVTETREGKTDGTGLVLASMAMGAQPLVMLPIIIYNLAQHLIAGSVDALLRRTKPF